MYVCMTDWLTALQQPGFIIMSCINIIRYNAKKTEMKKERNEGGRTKAYLLAFYKFTYKCIISWLPRRYEVAFKEKGMMNECRWFLSFFKKGDLIYYFQNIYILSMTPLINSRPRRTIYYFLLYSYYTPSPSLTHLSYPSIHPFIHRFPTYSLTHSTPFSPINFCQGCVWICLYPSVVFFSYWGLSFSLSRWW